MVKGLILAFSVATFAAGGVAIAQESATLVLRSGERVSGQLVDMGGSGFTITVNGQQREIPTSQVTVIDFVGGGQGLPETELSKITADRHLVLLKGGSSFDGHLYDISGTHPLRITFNTAGGERHVNSSEIGRIYLAHPGGTAVGTSGASPTTSVQPSEPVPAGAIVVAANRQWTPTGIFVQKGDVMTLSTTGQVRLSGDENDIAVAAGSRSGRRATNAPLGQALAGALIGRIGDGQVFGIGDQTTFTATSNGQLYLGVNDDGMDDNHGQFNVVITKTTPAGKRRR